MRHHRGVPLGLVLVAVGCIPLARAPVPVVCPPAPTPPPSANDRACLDCHGWGPTLREPYTIVVDGRIAATIGAARDSLRATKALAELNLNTIKTIEIVRSPRAQTLYPAATGDVVSITRCY